MVCELTQLCNKRACCSGRKLAFLWHVNDGNVGHMKKAFADRGLKVCMVARGPAAIDAELDRVRPLVEDGGYVPGPDHSLPPDVSFANYVYYMEKLLTIL